MNKKLEIVSFVSPTVKKKIQVLEFEWRKYFEINTKYPTEIEIKKELENKIDILFVTPKYFKTINNHQIEELNKKNNQFIYVVISSSPKETDSIFYKNFASNIIYTSQPEELIKWKSIAILRRYWFQYSKPSTIFHKDLIIDFIENKVSSNGKIINLTAKEIAMLKVFVENKGEYISKEKILEDVWGITDNDYSRIFDQMLFKLRKKLGNEYFESKRNKGVIFI